MNTPRLLLIPLLALCAGLADEPAKITASPANAVKPVRQHFVPVKFTGDNRASSTALCPSPEPGIAWVMANAGLGEMFPVRDETEKTLFEVKVAAGDDEHLVLEISTKEKTQKIEVPRDKRVLVDVAGGKYGLLFPWTEVNPTDKTTTSQPMIIVTRRPPGEAK